MISTQEDLNRLADKLRDEKAIAVDTEFHGERRYWPDLFLIQIADSSGPVAIDPLQIDDLSPLGTLFESESPIKVIHSARNDIDVLMHHLGVEFASVFDTQLAAAFLGHDRQTALFKLVKAECGIYPKKGHTLSDWSLRPLADNQIEYALDDVRYLLEIYLNQIKKLEARGRLGWYLEEAKSLTDPSTYNNAVHKLFRKVRSTAKVRNNRLHILWALIKWRENVARQVNKPRNFIVRDHILGAITAITPISKSALSRVRGISSGFISKWGDEILKVIADSENSPDEGIPEIPRYHSKPGVSARTDILRIFLKQESCRLDISPELLLSKDLINSLAKNPPDNEQELYSLLELSGWRKEALGDDLVSLLKGKLALKLNPNSRAGLHFIRVD
jgi:ribonuclease D